MNICVVSVVPNIVPNVVPNIVPNTLPNVEPNVVSDLVPTILSLRLFSICPASHGQAHGTVHDTGMHRARPCGTVQTHMIHGATGPHRECQVKAPGVGSGGLDLDLALTWACLGKLGLACRRINITIAWLGPLIANLGQNWTPTEHKGRHSNAACAKSGPRQAHVGPSGPDVGLTWGLTWPTWAGLPAKSGPRQAHGLAFRP